MEKSCERPERPTSIAGWLMSGLFWKNVRAIVIGGILGYLYWRFDGPNNIPVSGPWMTIVTGGFLGFFFVNRPCRSC